MTGPHRGEGPSWEIVVRRRPTLPPRLRGSTIGAGRLSFRVRNGSGRFPLAMAAGTIMDVFVRLPTTWVVVWFRPYIGNHSVDASPRVLPPWEVCVIKSS